MSTENRRRTNYGPKLCPFWGKVQDLSSFLGLLWPLARLFGRAEALELG